MQKGVIFNSTHAGGGDPMQFAAWQDLSSPPKLGGETDTQIAEKNEKNYEEAEDLGAGGEGDSSCAHSISDGDWHDQLHGMWSF